MKLVTALLSLSLPALTVSCGGEGLMEPPIGFPHAVATPWCLDTDAAAVAIFVSQHKITSLMPSRPYIRIVVPWRDPKRIEGSWSVVASKRIAFATLFRSSTEPLGTLSDIEGVAGGIVSVQPWTADSTVSGSIHITFHSTGLISGGFRARWIPALSDAYCG